MKDYQIALIVIFVFLTGFVLGVVTAIGAERDTAACHKSLRAASTITDSLRVAVNTPSCKAYLAPEKP